MVRYVGSGQVLKNKTLHGGEQIFVFSGGLVLGGTVNASGLLLTDDGALSNTTINSGGTTSVFFGTADRTIVNQGGTLLVGGPQGGADENGPVATGVKVNAGGLVQVLENAAVSALIVNSGGTVQTDGGGITGATVSSGGHLLLNGSEYGDVSGLDLKGGGTAIVENGQIIGGMVDSGGTVLVSRGGYLSNIEIHSGGRVVALPGASLTAVSGAGQIISTGVIGYFSGAVTIDTITNGVTVAAGGSQFILQAGTAMGTTVDLGAQYVDAGGVASGTVLIRRPPGPSLYSKQIVSSGGVAVATELQKFTNETVLLGGKSLDAVVGGYLELQGGISTGSLIDHGGTEMVLSGSTDGTVVTNGGQQIVNSAASAGGTSVMKAGLEIINAGAVVTRLTVFGGGHVDLPFLPYSTSGSASFDQKTDQLQITEAGSNFTLHLAGDYTGDVFSLQPYYGEEGPRGSTELTVIAERHPPADLSALAAVGSAQLADTFGQHPPGNELFGLNSLGRSVLGLGADVAGHYGLEPIPVSDHIHPEVY